MYFFLPLQRGCHKPKMCRHFASGAPCTAIKSCRRSLRIGSENTPENHIITGQFVCESSSWVENIGVLFTYLAISTTKISYWNACLACFTYSAANRRTTLPWHAYLAVHLYFLCYSAQNFRSKVQILMCDVLTHSHFSCVCCRSLLSPRTLRIFGQQGSKKMLTIRGICLSFRVKSLF